MNADKLRCRSKSAFGDCGRSKGHDGVHAVPIGDGVWFGYTRNRPARAFGWIKLTPEGWELL